MVKSERKSRILSEVHETARGMLNVGLISKRRMQDYDALCNLDVPLISPREIKNLREQAHVSQAVFAAVLNTSVSTVQKWEIGDKKPSGTSLKLLSLIQRKGIAVVL